jgi:hypothetical protein
MAFAPRYIDLLIRGLQYGTAAFGATPGAFTSLMAREIGMPETTRAMIQRMLQKPVGNRGPEAAIIGPQSWKIAFKLMMRGGKLLAGTGGDSEFLALAKYCGMTLSAGAGGSGKITGGSTITLQALDADLASYSVGMFILFKHSTYTSLRFISGKASLAGTTTLTFWPAVAAGAAPASSDSFYPCDTIVPDADNGSPSAYTGFDFFMGAGSTDRDKARLLSGCGSFKFPTMKTGEMPLAEFEFEGDNWATSEASATQDLDTYATPKLVLSDLLYFDDDAIEFESFGFDPGIKRVVKPAGSQANGRQGYFYRDCEPKVEIVPYWDEEWMALWAAGTQKKLYFAQVEDQLQAWGIAIPAVQIAGVKRGTIGGAMVSSNLDLLILDPHKNADATPVALPRFAIGVSAI